MNSKEKWITFLLLLSTFIGISNVMIIAPLLKLFKLSIGIKESQYGVVLGAYPILSFITSVIIGPISDKHGRRALLIIGLAGLSVCQLLTGFAYNFHTLVLFRALSGIFGALIGTSVYAYVADYFAPQKRIKVMGLVGGGMALAQIAGIPIGILVGGAFSWNTVFFVFAALSFILVINIIFFLPHPDIQLKKDKITLKTYQKKYSVLSKDKNILLSLFTYFIMFSGVFIFAGAYPTWLYNQFSPMGIGHIDIAILFTVAGFGSWLGSSLSGRLSAKVKDKLQWVGILNLVILIFIFSIPVFKNHFYFQFPLYFLMMVMGSLRFPVFQTIVLHLVGITERGSMSSSLNAMVQMGSAVGAFLSGWLFHNDPSFFLNVGAIGGIFVFASLLLLFVLKENLHKDNR